jgi:hypothetical protein
MSPEMASHGHSLKEFKAYREKMNEKILEKGKPSDQTLLQLGHSSLQ